MESSSFQRLVRLTATKALKMNAAEQIRAMMSRHILHLFGDGKENIVKAAEFASWAGSAIVFLFILLGSALASCFFLRIYMQRLADC